MQIAVLSADGLIEAFGAWIEQSFDGQHWRSLSLAAIDFGGVGNYSIPVSGVAGQYIRLAASLSNSLKTEGSAVAVLSAKFHAAVP